MSSTLLEATDFTMTVVLWCQKNVRKDVNGDVTYAIH